ncbi:MAG: mismatch repair protein MutL [Dehalococcoidia bacterium]|nr:mismatch repair protein MutL [Dehalococcoidia bacterium]
MCYASRRFILPRFVCRMPIKVLDPDVVAQIAAGEVIEEPSSAVKELVENSLDAGATRVWILVEGGGLRRIQVRDNGCGIPPAEVELAFHRHATSKLSRADHLSHISTMGFRGEALPSMAAVADVAIVTRTPELDWGTYLSLSNGSVVERGKRASPPGTTITLDNLFSNQPARRKFLPSASALNSRVAGLVSRLALGSPQVGFSLSVDGRISFQSPVSGSLRDTMASVYGAQVADSLLELVLSLPGKDEGIEPHPQETSRPSPTITGMVAPPSVTRATRSYVHLYVNGRWIYSRALAAAVEEAYHGLLMTGRHPLAVIHIKAPPDEIDVNVHPAKREVRFLKERQIFAMIQRSVRSALLSSTTVPSIAPGYADRGDPLTFPTSTRSFGPPSAGAATSVTHGTEIPQNEASALMVDLPIMRVLGQLSATYIIAEGPDGMYLVDQHAAHERVLFEKILGDLQGGHRDIQGFLEPLVWELTPEQSELLLRHQEPLRLTGFQIDPFGDGAWLVRGVPGVLNDKNPLEALRDILDQLAGVDRDGEDHSWQERMAASLACHSAVTAAHPLTTEEMRQIILQLERTANPRTCPHGRPTMLHLSSSLLEKQFGRR